MEKKDKLSVSAPVDGVAPPPDCHLFLVNSDIDDDCFNALVSLVTKCSQKKNKAILSLTTNGGQANSAYRISRLFQDCFIKFDLFIPSFCKSAGTLVATGADKLLFTPTGEIGPLDVQLLKRDELLGERKSGLLNKSAFDFLNERAFSLFEHILFELKTRSGGYIRFKSAAEIASKISSNVMSEAFKGFDLESIAEDYRDLLVAEKYAEKLNGKYKNVLHGGIQRLVREYPSHDFVIDHVEAKQLFRRVEFPPPWVMGLLSKRPDEFLNTRGGDSRIIEILTDPTENPPKEQESSPPESDVSQEKDGENHAPRKKNGTESVRAGNSQAANR